MRKKKQEEARDLSAQEQPQPSPKRKRGNKVHIAFFALGAVIAVLLFVLLLALLENNRLLREEMAAMANRSAGEGDADDAGHSREADGKGADTEGFDGKGAGTKGSDGKETDTKGSDGKDSSEESPDGKGTGTKESEGSSGGDAEADYLLTYSAANAWESGDLKMCGVEFGIANHSRNAVNGWTLILEIEGLSSAEGWNGSFSVKGDRLIITNAEHNGEIAPGGVVYTGCNLGATEEFAVKSAILNGSFCAVESGTVNQNAQNGNGQGDSKTPSADVAALLERAEDAVQGDDWLHTDGSRILDKDGKQVWITGVNWFGYNTGTNTFDGLWNSKLEPTVKAIADHGFNLIRVPISAQLINQWAAGEYPRANYNNAYNPALNDMDSLEIFDYFLDLAEGCGIKVMPDIHSAETDASGHNVNLWYTSKVSVEDYYAALEWMAERYKDNDTIIAYDLKNEPHGKPNEGKNAAIWNDSRDSNNWKYVAETAAARILAKNPNVLILVEGTEIYPKNDKGDYSSTDSEDYYFNWWGGNLRGVKDFPVDLGKYQDKLVYSPHDYGPTVYEQPWFQGGYTYESLMRDCWRDNWLYIQEDDVAPLLIGEWGGFMREPNLTWMTYVRQLIKTYHLNHTFWCLNANSGDTGGLLLDDFTTWDQEKYNFVKEVLWQEDGKFVGLDHAIPLGDNGITTAEAKGL